MNPRSHTKRTKTDGGGFLRVLSGFDLFLFFAFFLLYLLTLSPDVLPADSGEFQVIVPLLGVAHPPGFVLYTLLGKAWVTLIPFGAPAYRLNLLSALTGALTLVFVYRAVFAEGRARPAADHQPAGSPPPSPLPPPRSHRFPSRVACLLPAIALGVSTTFWAQSTTANVRSLTGLLTALALWLLTEIRMGAWEYGGMGVAPTTQPPNHPTPLPPPPATLHSPPSAFFILSLSLGVLHHASFAFVALVLGIYWLWLNRESLRSPRWWLRHLAIAALPWLMLIYLPIRGAQGAFLAPSRLATLQGFLEHVFATGFGGDLFYFADLAALPDRLAIFWNILTFQFNGVILLFALIGAVLAVRRDWRWGLMLVAAFGLHAFVAITYRAPQTVEYLLPAYVVLAVLAGNGLVQLQTPDPKFQTPNSEPQTPNFKSQTSSPNDQQPATSDQRPTTNLQSPISNLLVLIFAFASIALFARNLPSYLYLARDRSTREYAEAVLNAAPENAVVLSVWHWAAPMWYLQEIEGLRPDVEVVYVYPEGESLAETWVRRIEAEIGRRPVVVTAFYPREFAAAGHRFVPLGPAWRASDAPLAELSPGMTPASGVFGSEGWRLSGYEIGASSAEPGGSFPVTVAWQAPAAPGDIHFFLQLIGADGSLYGQADFAHPASSVAPGEFLIDRAEITVRADAAPGDYRLVTGAYLNDGTRLASPEGDQWPLATIRVLTRSAPPPTTHPTRWPVGSARLLGSDADHSLPDSIRLYLHWQLGDAPQAVTLWANGSPYSVLELPARPGREPAYLTTATELPPHASDLRLVPDPDRSPVWLDASLPDFGPAGRYVPLGGSVVLVGVDARADGDSGLVVDLEWLSARPLTQDLIAKVDWIGEGHAWKAESDSVPAGGAIPTLKWVFGSRVADRHRLTAPPNASPGNARLEVAMYDHFTQQVLPILDPRLAVRGPTVVVGE